MELKLLLTRKEAAQALSVSLRFLDGLIGSKQLQARRLGRRVLVEHRELERFVANLRYSSPRIGKHGMFR
jgi:excisionase family DNA binding protein